VPKQDAQFEFKRLSLVESLLTKSVHERKAVFGTLACRLLHKLALESDVNLVNPAICRHLSICVHLVYALVPFSIEETLK
jgi:hypothetical protein